MVLPGATAIIRGPRCLANTLTWKGGRRIAVLRMLLSFHLKKNTFTPMPQAPYEIWFIGQSIPGPVQTIVVFMRLEFYFASMVYAEFLVPSACALTFPL